MTIGKEIMAEVLEKMAQSGDRGRETAAQLYIQLTAEKKGLKSFDGDARKMAGEYWTSKVETCFFTDDVDGGCKLTWLIVGERTVKQSKNGKKSYNCKGGPKAKWLQVVSVEPYDMSRKQWNDHKKHIQQIMSAVSHGKDDPNAAIIDSLEDKQRWDMERIYEHMKDFLFLHKWEIVEKSERLMKQWQQWESELTSIDPRLHFNMIDYVYDERQAELAEDKDF